MERTRGVPLITGFSVVRVGCTLPNAGAVLGGGFCWRESQDGGRGQLKAHWGCLWGAGAENLCISYSRPLRLCPSGELGDHCLGAPSPLATLG